MGLLELPGTLIPFIVTLGVLIFVHEMGHFLVARWCGVKVEVFSIGFGRELFGWTDKKNTRWKVCLIPLGGYVKMFGDADVTSGRPAQEHGVEIDDGEARTGDWVEGQERPLTAEERAVSFHHKTLGQRAAIVAAGPAANFLFAFVVLAGFLMTLGQPVTPAVVGQVAPESAAEAAGLQSGDRFLEINGSEIERFEDIQRAVQLNLDAPMQIIVERDGAQVDLVATPRLEPRETTTGQTVQVPVLGIGASGTVFESYGVVEAIWRAGQQTWQLTVDTLKGVGQMVSGARSTEELGGPILIAQLSGQVAEAGIPNLIHFMALLSINLGLINLFPVPVLDGGHLMFYAVEALRGRPLGEKAQEVGFKIGLALVVALIVFVTWNDLTRILA